MQKRILILIFLILPTLTILCQIDSTKKVTDYSFIIQDSPSQLFTMRQMNQSYLSGYRLLARGLYSIFENDKIADLFQIGLQALFFIPLTHEEGHRTILTVNNIGSISQPYFNKYGAAYVKGVTDQTLQNLRDNDLPTYIRLHTAGLESDYMLTKRMETIGSFELDNFKNYKWEYWFRKLTILQYYITGLLKFEPDLTEEKNELERDIVGYDTYGVARHLYRPSMDFYRYTKYSDLTNEEKDYINRLGYRSLLNLLNPLILGINNFKLSETVSINFGLGYTMSPFGDFIDENLWIKHKSLNINFYVRQFQNKKNWFNGFGISVIDFQVIKKLLIDLSGHFWQQPIDYNFSTADYFTGGAIDMTLRYFVLNDRIGLFNNFSVDIGLMYKSEGFLPEELYLDENFGIRIGTTLRLK